MQIVAHRGASYSAPENTLESLRLAWEQGADGTEFDVVLSADGEAVLFHDYTPNKTASRLCPKALCMGSGMGLSQDEYEQMLTQTSDTLSYWDFLRHLDVGSWKGPEWAGVHTATLEEAMREVPQGKYALCEIKGHDKRLAKKIVDTAVKEGYTADRFIIIGFSLENMIETKRLLMEAGLGDILVSFLRSANYVHEAAKAVMDSAENGMTGTGLKAMPTTVTEEVVAYAHRQGLEVGTWVTASIPGLDTVENAERMEGRGLDSFTTDLTPEIREWMARRP